MAIVGLDFRFPALRCLSSHGVELGRSLGDAVSASAALLLAVMWDRRWFVSRVRRVAGANLHSRCFDYDVMRVESCYVDRAVIGIAALNTGNNLLYIIVAAMLAAIMVSGFASAIVLRDLELEVRFPEHVFAGRTMWAELFCGIPGGGCRPFR